MICSHCKHSGFLQKRNCPQLSTLQLKDLICDRTARDSLGSSKTSERSVFSYDKQHCSHTQLIMNHVHMWSALFCQALVRQLVFQLQCSLYAFRHLLPACAFIAAAVRACICCLPACLHACFLASAAWLYAFMLLSRGITPLVLHYPAPGVLNSPYTALQSRIGKWGDV